MPTTKRKKRQVTAAVFFYSKITKVLHSGKGSAEEKITVLDTADSKFKKKTAVSSQKNFGILLDQELFATKEKNFQKLGITIPKQPSEHALGLLEVVAAGAALDERIFGKAVKIYEAAYQKTQTSLLAGALNHENFNLLHVICSVLADHAEGNSIEIAHWAVYKSLVHDHHYEGLLKETDKYERTPTQLLEEAELVECKENPLLYAIPR